MSYSVGEPAEPAEPLIEAIEMVKMSARAAGTLRVAKSSSAGKLQKVLLIITIPSDHLRTLSRGFHLDPECLSVYTQPPSPWSRDLQLFLREPFSPRKAQLAAPAGKNPTGMLLKLAHQKYSLVVAPKLGVRCKTCGKGIEIDDDYLPGIHGAELAARLYKHFDKPDEGRIVGTVSPWPKTLRCENPDCRETHTYGAGDLRLYDE
jgi:hypothetical protein